MKHVADTGKQNMKRLLTLIISLIMILSLMPSVVFADNDAGTAQTETPVIAEEPVAPEEPQVPDEPIAPEEPVTPPVTVEVKGAGLRVKWQKIDGAKTYRVYRSYKRLTGYKLIKKGIKGLSFTDKTVASGKKAYYKVRALKTNGKYSKYTKPVSGKIYRVYIETGHGIGDDGVWDPGCAWNGYQEARLMIPVCKAATKYLREKGVYVYTDAFNKNNKNLEVTLKFIKTHSVSVLLNVHCDYYKAPSGTMPLYRYSNQKKLARCLNKGVHKYVQIKDRGLTKRTDLKTLNKTKAYCTACLFEVGSIRRDNKLLRTKYDAIGMGLAKGVCDYLGVEWQ
jgi:N-acetylmuramoyl-L-alanine amidase